MRHSKALNPIPKTTPVGPAIDRSDFSLALLPADFDSDEGTINQATENFNVSSSSDVEATPGTEHTPQYTPATFAPNVEGGGVVRPGSMFRIKVSRDNSVGSNMSTNAELLGALVYESASP